MTTQLRRNPVLSKMRWLVAVGVLVGALAGVASPRTAKATAINIELRVYGGATSYLTCGWHSDCSTGSETSGVALDWDNGDNSNVYWRSYGYRSDGVNGTIAYGYTSHYESGLHCNVIGASLNDAYGFEKGLAEYHHTSAWVFFGSGGIDPFAVGASGSWQWTQTSAIGFSVTSEDYRCPFTDGQSHLHQIQGQSYWVWRGVSGSSCGGYYPDYNCQGYTYSSWLSRDNYQFKQTWCWFCQP